ncbi:MAG: C4-type zinc ribbon domain-containing protein [Thermodesulfovibrionales bacterium]|nr:C4-type zinc ribbon domain-containing protein [Thermodesulfovibrionales bacterium]
MNRQIELLMELQKLDSGIIEKTRRIASIPAKISAVEKPLNDAKSLLEAERLRLTAIEKKKKDKEREADGINDKINKSKARTSEIKTNKEYQAHLKEIEAGEKERSVVEDAILNLMVELDAVSAGLKSAEKTVAEEQKKVDAVSSELQEEVKGEEKELHGLKAGRPELTKSVEPELYGFYMSLLDALGGLAVVEAKGERCKGCNMNIPPQLFVELKNTEEIIQCPQCRRILYFMEAA